MKTELFLTSALALFAVSCTLTGDPTKGGIFWSPDKAIERQQHLMNENQALQAELNEEMAQTQSLIAQQKNLRAQIAAKKAELARTKDAAQVAILSKDISNLERQLAEL